MLGLVFAQIVTVAHACTLAVPMSQTTEFSQPADDGMPPDCAGMAKHGSADAKVCDSHCAYGLQIDVPTDAPVAAISPQPALTVGDVSSRTVLGSLDSSFLHARSTAPPVSLLFSRFQL
ncbi:MAG: hypothetical protein ABJA83_16300 [Burkholderiaceae bacterium]